MAKSIDVAVDFLKKSIKRGQDNPKYYMNYVKLHKLIYLAQCDILFNYDMKLFDDNITATDEGPYIDGLEMVVVKCGFDNILNIDDLKKCVIDLPLSFSRDETVDFILDKYSEYSTREIVLLANSTIAYQLLYDDSFNKPIPIKEELLKLTGMQLEEGTLKNIYELSCGMLCEKGLCLKMRKKIKE